MGKKKKGAQGQVNSFMSQNGLAEKPHIVPQLFRVNKVVARRTQEEKEGGGKLPRE